LGVEEEKGGQRGRKARATDAPSRPKAPSSTDASRSSGTSRSAGRKSGEMGHALRSAYQRMVDEDIPPEMLDLLGKLG
jgi:hypothetical protein